MNNVIRFQVGFFSFNGRWIIKNSVKKGLADTDSGEEKIMTEENKRHNNDSDRIK